MTPNAAEILKEVLRHHDDAEKWLNSDFEAVKRISNTKVGRVGQDFLEALASAYELRAEFPVNARGVRAQQSPWDIKLEGIRFELKTATEDVKGHFQFNHIRYHRQYDAVLCLGIAPNTIYFGLWSKADLATGKAGGLVSMEKSANASYKLTKRPNQLHIIEHFHEQFVVFREGWQG